jgi:hypothetical protein
MPGADPKEVATLEKKILLSGIEREKWWTGGQHEVTFALNLRTLDVLEFGGGGYQTRDEWKKGFEGLEYWLTGSIDYLYDNGGVNDLKTGAWPVYAATSKQLRSYALYPWVKAGCPLKGWNPPLEIDWWQRYRLDALPIRSGVETSGFELRDHLEDLRWASEHPEEVNPGDEQCRWCDSRPLCPAWRDEDKETGGYESQG